MKALFRESVGSYEWVLVVTQTGNYCKLEKNSGCSVDAAVALQAVLSELDISS